MNILTIDLEDWFHILAHEQTARRDQWEKFESRVEENTEWILGQLAANGQRATFFCLGWIARKYPALIKEIAGEGHEIACHSMNHELVYLQNRESFKSDLVECLHLLEDISGRKVITYRAPGFSVSEKTKWFFEVLIESGIENDCSVFPAGRNHGGFPDFPSHGPCIVSMQGKRLKEFPVSISTFGPASFAFAGGGYFRLLPYAIIQSLVKKSPYVMTYFHPRDFDASQPVIRSLPLKRKFMSYVGLHGAKQKFGKLLIEFRFVNVRDAVDQISWNQVPVVTLD